MQSTTANGITSNFIIDFVGKYHVTKRLSLSAKIINVLDETYAVAKCLLAYALDILLGSTEVWTLDSKLKELKTSKKLSKKVVNLSI